MGKYKLRRTVTVNRSKGLGSGKRLTLIAVALLLVGGLFAAIKLQPTAYAAGGVAVFKICNSIDGYTAINVYDGGGNRIDYLQNGECTGYVTAHGVRVDTDPWGPSHSYKIKPIGTGASGVYGPCHTNSDNHSSDPPQSPNGYSWTVYYKNYNQGNCTD